jgi:hypothetical protein
MKILRRSRRLARLAGCTALTLGLAGGAAVFAWGGNSSGQLGDGTLIAQP